MVCEQIFARETEENIKRLKELYAARLNAAEEKLHLAENGKISGIGAINAEDLYQKTVELYGELLGLNPEMAAELRPLIKKLDKNLEAGRLESIYDNVRAKLGAAITMAERTKLIRSELIDYLKTPLAGEAGLQVMDRIAALASQDQINQDDFALLRKEYFQVLRDTLTKEARRIMALETYRLLKEKGYSLLDAKGDSITEETALASKMSFLANDSNDYRVACSLDPDNNLIMQRLKVVSSKEEALEPLSGYQKARNLEENNIWCELLKEIAQKLQTVEIGAVSEVLEGSEATLPVLVDPKLKLKKERLLTSEKLQRKKE
jgi:hypothetical protein